MPQTQRIPDNDIDRFVEGYRNTPPAQRDQFVQSFKVTSNAPASSSDEDELERFIREYRLQQQSPSAPPQPTSTAPLLPFRAPTATQPLDVRAAKVDQPLIPMRPPMMDTAQVPLNVFTSRPQAPGMATVEEAQREGSLDAAPQSLAIRVARAVGAGAPEGSVVASLTGQRGTKTNLRLFAPEELMTESEQQDHPILAGAGDFLGGMTSPENLALIGLTAGAGQLAGPGSAVVKRLLAAGFSLPAMASAARMTPAIGEAFRKGQI
jgi:hypothetical protein